MDVSFDVIAAKRAPLRKGYMVCITLRGGKHEFHFFVCTGKDGNRICRFASAPNRPIASSEWVKVKEKAEKLDKSGLLIIKASLSILKNEEKGFRELLVERACLNKNITPAFLF